MPLLLITFSELVKMLLTCKLEGACYDGRGWLVPERLICYEILTYLKQFASHCMIDKQYITCLLVSACLVVLPKNDVCRYPTGTVEPPLKCE